MNIIGNKNIVNFLDKSIETGTLAHSYIFHGPKNVGKYTLARELAAKVLNTNLDSLHQQIDFIEIAPEGNQIRKEEIDRIILQLRLSSFSGGHKVLIIKDAHTMNTSASNAFLKTLEEPPQKTLILLITRELGRMLPTIVSRTSVLKFNLVLKEEIQEFIKNKYSNRDAKDYAKISFGRPGRAIKLLDLDWQNENKAKINQFHKLFFGNIYERFKVAETLVKGDKSLKNEDKKENLLQNIDFWLEIVRDIFLYKYQLNDEITHSASYETIEIMANKAPAKYFSSLGSRLIKMRELVRQNINIQLMLENLII